MPASPITSMAQRVALRKESVDRNGHPNAGMLCAAVALRKESVDRNRVKKRLDGLKGRRRSPQGERG